MNTAEQLDGGFCYRFGALPDGFASLPLLEQTVVLAVPEHSALGKEGSVDARDLSGTPFIAFPRHVYAAYYDRLISACADCGLTLDIRQEASTETAILSLVAAGGRRGAGERRQPRASARARALRRRARSFSTSAAGILLSGAARQCGAATLHRFAECTAVM